MRLKDRDQVHTRIESRTLLQNTQLGGSNEHPPLLASQAHRVMGDILPVHPFFLLNTDRALGVGTE